MGDKRRIPIISVLLGLVFAFPGKSEIAVSAQGSSSVYATTPNGNSNSSTQPAKKPTPKSARQRRGKSRNKRNSNASSEQGSPAAKINADDGRNASTAGANKTVATNANSTGARKRVVDRSSKGRRTTVAAQNLAGSGISSVARARTKPDRCNPEKDERADLSGKYVGSVNYPEGPMSGEAILTISVNQFTLGAGNQAYRGRITAVTTCRYTAVTMMFGEPKVPAPGEPAPPRLPTISLRATKTDNSLTLKSVESEPRLFAFVAKFPK